MDRIIQVLDDLRNLSLLSIFVRYVLVIICGGIIGIERGKKRHAAGMRTYLVVCMGAAGVMMLNQYLLQTMNPNADPSRLGAQVISGIGFLGVGTIVITGKNQVKGLTTAAGLWASACMGLAIGAGFYEGAIMMCIFLYLVLEVLNRLDERYIKFVNVMRLYIEHDHSVHFGQILRLLNKNGWSISSSDQLNIDNGAERSHMLCITHCAKNIDGTNIIEQLKQIDGISFVEQL